MNKLYFCFVFNLSLDLVIMEHIKFHCLEHELAVTKIWGATIECTRRMSDENHLYARLAFQPHQ